MKKISKEQLRKHKDIQIQDLYKLICQAEFGLHHHDVQKLVTEEYSKACSVRGWVKKEPILEKISEDYYRLNIRAYMLELNNDTMLILAASDSKKLSKGKKEGLIQRWNDFKKLNSRTKLFPKEDVTKFEEVLKEKDFPMMHHSKEYKKANDPCYIVLHKEAIKFWYKEKWL